LGLAQFYSTDPNPPRQPAHRPFSLARAPGRRSDRASCSCAPCHLPSRPPRAGHAAPPRAPVPPSLSSALSSVRSKVCSNRQHHRHLARPRSTADVVPLLPTVGRHRREPPRRASSRRSSCPSVCLNEPSRGAPPPHRSAATSGLPLLPPSGTPPWAGHSGPPPASPSPPRAHPWLHDVLRTQSQPPRPRYRATVDEPPPIECRHRGDAISSEPLSPPSSQTSPPPPPRALALRPNPPRRRPLPNLRRHRQPNAMGAAPLFRVWATSPWR
jgi:hypothetical protein